MTETTLSHTEIGQGKLQLSFSGRSTIKDAKDIFEWIFVTIERTKNVQTVIFDLRRIDLINNIAGRLRDIARECARRFNVRVEFHIPHNIYLELQSFEPGVLPLKPSTAPIDGVQFKLTQHVTAHEPGVSPFGPSFDAYQQTEGDVIFSCLGRIERIDADVVTVLLFSTEGEIVGKLGRRQFPNMIIARGKMFRYKAMVLEPGDTRVRIEDLPERKLSGDDILDVWEETRRLLPENLA